MLATRATTGADPAKGTARDRAADVPRSLLLAVAGVALACEERTVDVKGLGPMKTYLLAEA